jgi:hypothetical protein
MRTRHKYPPTRVPTGNVDEVLLTGKRRGKDLTLFQALGLAVVGFCVLFGIGIPAIILEFHSQPEFQKLGLSFPTNVNTILIGILMCLLGTSWVAIGLIGAVKAARRESRRRSSSK